MTHLSPEELIDVLDGGLSPARRRHFDDCDACRGEAAELRVLLGEVRATVVPQPSAFFWDRFSARVREAIADEPSAPLARWFHWPVLVPITALALLVLGLVATVPLTHNSLIPQAANVAAAGEGGETELASLDTQWAMLADLVGDLDIESVEEVSMATHPGAADRAILQLSLGEQEELLRLLREELREGGS
jgi:hypothetical protein